MEGSVCIIIVINVVAMYILLEIDNTTENMINVVTAFCYFFVMANFPEIFSGVFLTKNTN